MRKFSSKLSVKITSIAISAISFLLLFAMVICVIFMNAIGFYENSLDDVNQTFLRLYDNIYQDCYDDCSLILEHHMNDTLDEYNAESDNLYTISIGSRVVASNYNGETNYIPYTAEIGYYDDFSQEFYFNFTVTVYYPSATPFNLEAVEFLYNMRYTLIVNIFVLAIVFLVSLIVLLSGAGYNHNSDTVALRPVDKIPFDIYTAILAFLFIKQIELFNSSFYFDLFPFIVVCCVVAVDYLLLLNYIYSFTILIRAQSLIKRSILFHVVRIIFNLLKKFITILTKFFMQLPFIWKTVLVLIIWSVTEFWVLSFVYNNFVSLSITWLVIRLIVFTVIINISLVLNKIKKSGKKIAEGDLNHRLDTTHMVGDFKEFGENLNNISEGMGRAVEDKLKSERFKTELITNVSHDIKTPLTSIINYVDLIKKETPENDKVNQYISVLDRQSSRLKKLIEDLIEASKASTGNLKVTLVPCALNVLFTQITGEYEEILNRSSLELVVDHPKDNVNIMADGRHLWRVIDNLMNNIRKYAMEGTRVYITLTCDEQNAYVTFRNISKYPLNITSDELMERFTRGDSSRNTEGSGLGISIAKSLTELQGGSFSLDIDGDLFKATLTFSLLK